MIMNKHGYRTARATKGEIKRNPVLHVKKTSQKGKNNRADNGMLSNAVGKFYDNLWKFHYRLLVIFRVILENVRKIIENPKCGNFPSRRRKGVVAKSS